MGPLVHAERDVSRLGGVVDRVESLLPELFHGLGRHQQVSVRELLQNARPECRASPTIDTHLSVGSLLDAQRVEGVETVGGRREGARPRRGPLPPGLPFRFAPKPQVKSGQALPPPLLPYLLLFLYGIIEHTMNGMYLDVTITILSSLNRWFFVALMIFTSLEEVDSGMEGGAGLVLHRATDGPKLSELLPWWWRSESLPNEP
jgi:hypothetical protein